MDERSGEFLVSVWADPDIGEAMFYIVIEAPDHPTSDFDLDVSMWTRPVSGRLKPVTYPARRTKLRNRVQYETRPHFDQRDMWEVGFEVRAPGLRAASLTREIESTPPGFGVWDLAVYTFPFLLIGVLWITAMIRRRQQVRRA
jgi:hypothetical protein